LSIENPPSRPCPWPGNHACVWPPLDSVRERHGIVCADKRAQETAEGVVVGREDAGDVFPEGVAESIRSSKFMCQHRIGESKIAAGVRERETAAGE
jgi:hypothetical protein